MTVDQWVERIRSREAPAPAEAQEVLLISAAVLTTLGERLSRLEAEALAEDLPGELAPHLRAGPHGQAVDAAEFYRRVARRGEVRPGLAVEWTSIVLRTIAGVVGPEVAGRTRAELPESLARQLAPAPPPVAPPAHLHPERRTLAEGEPGGARPLYSARPDAGHSQSVARSDDPHAETRLSSARGLTQEREGRTLASGKPGSERAPGEKPE